MSEPSRFKEQKTPVYSVKGYLPQRGEWLSVQTINRTTGEMRRVSLKFVDARYVGRGTSGVRSQKYVYFESAFGKAVALDEDDLLRVERAPVSPVILERIRASRVRV